MKKYIALTIIIILGLSCSTAKKKVLEHYIKAKDLYTNNDIKTAASEIDLAINLDSTNLDFQITKAKIILATDNYELAIKILNNLLAKNFKLDTVNYNLGSCYFDFGNQFLMQKNDLDTANAFFEKALFHYNNAININSQYFFAYVSKQKVLHNLQRYNEALVVLNTAINLFPDSISLICNRGVEKINVGDLKGALIDLNNALESKKLDSLGLATAYRFRGHLYFKKGKIDKAIDDLTSSLEYNPKNEYALVTRGNYYKIKGLKDEACADYRKAGDLGFISIYEKIKAYCKD